MANMAVSVRSDPKKKTLTVNCLLQNFSGLTTEIRSEAFHSNFRENFKWFVLVYPKGENSSLRDWVSIFVCNFEKSNNVTVRQSFSIIGANNEVVFKIKTDDPLNYISKQPGKGWGFKKFMRRSDIEKLLVNGNLKLRVGIKYVKIFNFIDATMISVGERVIGAKTKRNIAFQCTVRDFMQVKDTKIASNVLDIPFTKDQWIVELYPRGFDDRCKEWLSLYTICSEETLEDMGKRVTCQITGNDGLLAYERNYVDFLPYSVKPVGRSYGESMFITRDETFELVADGDLVLRVLIEYTYLQDVVKSKFYK